MSYLLRTSWGVNLRCTDLKTGFTRPDLLSFPFYNPNNNSPSPPYDPTYVRRETGRGVRVISHVVLVGDLKMITSVSLDLRVGGHWSSSVRSKNGSRE